MNCFLDVSGLSFQDWLWKRYHITPIIHLSLCRQTARYGSGREEYEKSMAWLRRRYRYERNLVETLEQNNPFKEDNHD